ncbi:MAG: hypothetical protein WBA93_28530 [Microcoleaceae cyanobacterium]
MAKRSIIPNIDDGNIGFNYRLGPFGVSFNPVDNGTFGADIGIFGVKMNGYGGGSLSYLGGLYKFEYERKGCTLIEKGFVGGVHTTTDIRKIPNCDDDILQEEPLEFGEEKTIDDFWEDYNEDDTLEDYSDLDVNPSERVLAILNATVKVFSGKISSSGDGSWYPSGYSVQTASLQVEVPKGEDFFQFIKHAPAQGVEQRLSSTGFSLSFEYKQVSTVFPAPEGETPNSEGTYESSWSSNFPYNETTGPDGNPWYPERDGVFFIESYRRNGGVVFLSTFDLLYSNIITRFFGYYGTFDSFLRKYKEKYPDFINNKITNSIGFYSIPGFDINFFSDRRYIVKTNLTLYNEEGEIVKKKKSENPNKPPERIDMDKQCCNSIKRIEQALGVERLIKEKFYVPNELMIPGSEGGEYAEDYMGIYSRMVSVINQAGFSPFRVELPTPADFPEDEEKPAFSYPSQQAALQAMMSFLIDNKIEQRRQSILQIRLARMSGRMYLTLGKLWFRVTAILDGLGIPTRRKRTKETLEFNLLESKKKPQGFKEGSDELPEFKETEDELVDDFLQNSVHEFTIDVFKKGEKDIRHWLIYLLSKKG